MKSDIVLTGSQDRKAGVYNLKTDEKYAMDATFFVYGVGLSPSGRYGAYSFDVKNDVKVFDTKTKEVIGVYKTTGAIVNGIYFLNEEHFFIYGNTPKIGLYRR